MKLDEVKALLAASNAEHPAPWAPDGNRVRWLGTRPEVDPHTPAGDPNPEGDVDPRDILDANEHAVVRRDCGVYEPYGATYRLVMQAPTIIAGLVKQVGQLRQLLIDTMWGPLKGVEAPTVAELDACHSALGIALNEGMADESTAWALRDKLAKLEEWMRKIEAGDHEDLGAEVES